jgi:hypothetical protein
MPTSNRLVFPHSLMSESVTSRTAVYGPVRTVVWQGSVGDRRPYADLVGNCPPAGTVAIGSDDDCGDDFMQALLPAGTYTLVLTDANYIPNAIYDNGALSKGFTDLTAGVFQTCDPVSNACITTNGNYAVDITSTSAFAPEPDALSLMAIGSAALVGLKQFRKRRQWPHAKGEHQ